MSDIFHTLFGQCRQDGGTKKACYKQTIKALKSGGRSKHRGGTRRRRKASSWCARWGYSRQRGVPVCTKRRKRRRS